MNSIIFEELNKKNLKRFLLFNSDKVMSYSKRET